MSKFKSSIKLVGALALALSIHACSDEKVASQENSKKQEPTIAAQVANSIIPAANAATYEPITIKTGGFNLGKKASKEEIAGWHIEVTPTHNLPTGQGTASDGEDLFDEHCASCHGSFGEGVGRNPVLAGGEGTLKDKMKPERTVGSYWPHASTLLDYTHRAMPFPSAQSLSWDDTWALSAYVLYLNDIIDDEDFVFNAESYKTIKMPNEAGFVLDERPDTHNTRCMKNCKDAKDINVKTALLGYGSGAEDVVEETKVAKGHELGQKIYDGTCRLCHGTGLAGAPKIEDTTTWEHRLKQGLAKVHKHAIDGFSGQYGVMPPKGGNMDLTEEEVKAAVDFMLKDVEQ